VFLHWQQKLRKGFTLVELMVTVAIIVILSVVAGVSINSRIQVARLESAAQQLVSDLSYARSAAMFKGCSTRLIFCNTKACTSSPAGPVVVASVTATNGATTVVGSGTTPSLYYAILRNSSTDTVTPHTCSSSTAVPNTSDGYAEWDFDRRPQQISQGLAFQHFYSPGFGYQKDWWQSSDPDSLNSIWFTVSLGEATIPLAALTFGNALSGDPIIMQVQFDSCVPATADDCPAYLITMGSGGNVQMVKCAPGARTADDSDFCF